jgi:hypothetical protein
MRRPLGFALRSVRLPGGPPRTSARSFDPCRHAQTRSRKAEGTRDPRKSRRSDEEDLAPPLQDRSVLPFLIRQAAGAWSNGWVIDLCAFPAPSESTSMQTKGTQEPDRSWRSRDKANPAPARHDVRRHPRSVAMERCHPGGSASYPRVQRLSLPKRTAQECRMVTIERPLRGAWGRLYAAGCVTSATGWRTNAA